jgi:outer membrane lipoprotein SlyB
MDLMDFSAWSTPMTRTFTFLVTATALVTLTACSTTSPDVISRQDANRMSTVLDATVLSVRSVTVEGNQSGVGAGAGGVVGAIAGAVVGNAVERMGTREEAVEIMVQLRNGERRAIVQAKGSEQLKAGDAVVIVTSGGKTRVSRAPS